jgi:hypothetical protein
MFISKDDIKLDFELKDVNNKQNNKKKKYKIKEK